MLRFGARGWVYSEAMTVMVEIPDAVAAQIVPQGADAARKILEDAMAQAYREEKIGVKALREALGMEWFEVDRFLSKYQITDYTADDFRQDVRTLDELHKKHALEPMVEPAAS